MTTTHGHLFVVHGDLTTLACDGLVIPSDGMSVSRFWFTLFDAEAPAEGYGPLPDGARLRARPPGPSRWRTVNTVDVRDISDMVDQVTDTVEQIGLELSTTNQRSARALPLVALPLPGTGEGDFPGERGAVISQLLGRLRDLASQHKFDVALVLKDRADFAAAQQQRPANAWRALDEGEIGQADRLGRLAGTGELSLFIGAGVSQPLGLPSWEGLVQHLATRAGETDGELPTGPEWEDLGLLERAEAAKTVLGRDFHGALSEKLTTQYCAISHALLAGLGLVRMVTTNFDQALEIAHLGAFGPDRLRVMATQWATSDRPWLLKLHGDLGREQSIILTREQYDDPGQARQPLYGLVQGLLMTSHLLFVGFSLTDEAFLTLAEKVDDLYRQAGAESGHEVATVLSLEPLVESKWALSRSDAVNKISMVAADSQGDLPYLARRLEIFLDRMSWAASGRGRDGSGYFLDQRYEGVLTTDGLALRDALLKVANLSANAPDDSTVLRVRGFLNDLGLGQDGKVEQP